MSLYTEAAEVIKNVQAKKGSVKSLVLSWSSYPNKKQLYALVCETLKNSEVLKSVGATVGLLDREEILCHDEHLLQVLLYDQLIGRGIKRAHSYRIAVQRYRSALKTEYKKQKEEMSRKSNKDGTAFEKQLGQLPRYARINLLKATVKDVINYLETDGWTLMEAGDNTSAGFLGLVSQLEEYQFMVDPHLIDLLIFPTGTDLHNHALCDSGEIILQDKASCFPAHILAPPGGAEVIDCCAAPGNKTSHLASLMGNTGTIFAFDKDARRLSTMRTLIAKAGVTCAETKHGDFLNINPKEELFQNVEYILVDPSCSGSGMVSRMHNPADRKESSSDDRLASLSRFQIIILKHALKFPRVKRVVYSTCSIYPEENEMVVDDVFSQVSDKFSLTTVMPEWKHRGQSGYQCQAQCIRMSPEQNLTNGFFIACFERKVKKKNKKGKGGNCPDNSEYSEKNSVEFMKSEILHSDHHLDIGRSAQSQKRKTKCDVTLEASSETIVRAEPALPNIIQEEAWEVTRVKRKKKRKTVAGLVCGNEALNTGNSSRHECETSDKINDFDESKDFTGKRKKKKHHHRDGNHSVHDEDLAEALIDDNNHGNMENYLSWNEGQTEQKRKKKKAKKVKIDPCDEERQIQPPSTSVNFECDDQISVKIKHKKKKKHRGSDAPAQ